MLESAMMNFDVSDAQSKNIGFATNGCQGSMVLESMFAKMVKDDGLKHTQHTLKLMKRLL